MFHLTRPLFKSTYENYIDFHSNGLNTKLEHHITFSFMIPMFISWQSCEIKDNL